MFHKMTPEQWYGVLNTNLNSLFNMCRPVIEGMRERGFGRIVNISSINGQKGQMGQVNYSAAKAGDIGFTKALAQENACQGDHRQRHLPRLHRHRNGDGGAEGGAGESDPAADPGAPPRRARTRSPAASSSSPPTSPASSPVRPSPPTAGSTWRERAGGVRPFLSVLSPRRQRGLDPRACGGDRLSCTAHALILDARVNPRIKSAGTCMTRRGVATNTFRQAPRQEFSVS